MFKPTGINNKLKLVGGSLSFIVIAVIVLSVLMNERTKKDSLIINIAGKQRMLTQRITKEIFYDVYQVSTDFRVVNSAMNTFENSLGDLTEGNSAKGIYPPQNIKITQKLEEVKKMWLPFKSKILRLEKNIEEMKPNLDVFTIKINKILDLSNIIVKKMVKNKMDRAYIDLSGRQRMLSQRMGLFFKQYLRTSSNEDYLHYTNSKKLYNDTIVKFLNDKNIKENKEVFEATKKAYGYWQGFEKYSTKLINLQKSINQDLQYVYNNNVKILNTMDEAVWLFTDYSEQKNMLFVYIQFLFLSIGLVIILYSFLLSNEIMDHVKDFIDKTKMLATLDVSNMKEDGFLIKKTNEDELDEASSYINSFVSKVNLALNHSQDAIDKAEKAVEELEELSDNANEALFKLNLDEADRKGFDIRMSASEDIAIESTENLLHVTKMLEKLKANLSNIAELSNAHKEEKIPKKQ